MSLDKKDSDKNAQIPVRVRNTSTFEKVPRISILLFRGCVNKNNIKKRRLREMNEQVVLGNGFCEMTEEEVQIVIGGNAWSTAAAAFGILAISWSPVLAFIPGVGWVGAVTIAGVGSACIGYAEHSSR